MSADIKIYYDLIETIQSNTTVLVYFITCIKAIQMHITYRCSSDFWSTHL